MNKKFQSVLIVVIILVVFVSSITLGFAESSQHSSSGYYQLNLVIEKQSMDNNNSSGMYSFYVMENGALESSSVIQVPFGKEVKITIINHDNGISQPFVPSADNVSGVVGESVLAANGVSHQVNQNDAVLNGSYIKEIPAAQISHTFSTNTGLNIPIYPNSTEVAYTYFNTVGDYSWGCMCQCGNLPMDSPGSMLGQLIVLPP
jgi:hypothetical protein